MKKTDPVLSYLQDIKKQTSSDTVLFVHHNDDCTLQHIYDLEKNVEKTIDLCAEDSIIEISAKKSTPLIENDVNNSFIFNQKVDNPFGLSAMRYGVIPIYSGDGSRHAGGFFLLYQTQKNKTAYEKDIFLTLQKRCGKLVEELSGTDAWKNVLKTPCRRCSKTAAGKSGEDVDQAYQFFSSIVHDMRTPINATLGFLELLENEVDSSQKEYIIAASRSAEMVTSLVNDVLDFSKIKTGNLEIDLHYFSPFESFRNIAYTFYHTAWKKGVVLSLFLDPSIPLIIKSDPYRIKQIVNNFLSNAIKFTPEKGYVDLLFEYDKEKDILTVKVKDTGIGIDKKAIKKIFEPFQQASKETSGRYGGTGLGLSISKYLAERLDAQIAVDSTPGKGSTFSLSLPCHTIADTPSSIHVDYRRIPFVSLVQEAQTDPHHIAILKRYFEMCRIPHEIVDFETVSKNVRKEATYLFSDFDYTQEPFKRFYDKHADQMLLITPDMMPDSLSAFDKAKILHRPIFPNKLFRKILEISGGSDSSRAAGTKTKVRETINVLVADDNLINRKLMQKILEKIGTKPYLAVNADEAMEIFEKSAIDIIFMDEVMPGEMDGSDAIRKMRAMKKGKTLPIYSLTGSSSQEVISKIKNAGATEVLLKPVQNSRLEQIINDYRYSD